MAALLASVRATIATYFSFSAVYASAIDPTDLMLCTVHQSDIEGNARRAFVYYCCLWGLEMQGGREEG